MEDSNEPETIEIHGREGLPYEFNQNEQVGLRMGGTSTSGNCPSLTIVLTEHQVYVVNDSTRNKVCQTGIEFDHQWYDHDGNPVGEDDPAGSMGKPTEPKEGAVEEAISDAWDKAKGFQQGWKTRHQRGPNYSDMESYAESLLEKSSVKDISGVREENEEFEAVVEIANEQWGLPNDVYSWLSDHPTLEMVDITDIKEDRIYIIIDKDKSRASR